MTLRIVFSHGLEGKQWGSKIKAMGEHVKQLGELHSLNYEGIKSPDERTQRLIEFIKTLPGDIVLVGSSMGGYVSVIASNNPNVKGLMLLAPALYLNGYQVLEPSTPCSNVVVIHGWNDDVVPYQNSIKFAHEHKIPLKLLNDGHRLANSQTVLNAELELLVNDVIKRSRSAENDKPVGVEGSR